MGVSSIVRDPAFATRLEHACDVHPHCPALNYGRLQWLRKQLHSQGVDVSYETIRKWLKGEARPLPARGEKLAKVLDVDDVWLLMGHNSGMDLKERRVRNAIADGVVNVVAGLIQMDGGNPAFPESDEVIDLHAIIRGAKYDFHIVSGTVSDGLFHGSIPSKHTNIVVLGVVREGFSFQIFELADEVISEHGKLHGGSTELAAPVESLNRIESFAHRL